MTNPDDRVALAEKVGAGAVGTGEEVSPRRVEVPSEERQKAEKPQASEEIVIEEISIDGMCGVY